MNEQLALLHDTAAWTPSWSVKVRQSSARTAGRPGPVRDLGLPEHIIPGLLRPFGWNWFQHRDCATHLVTPVKFDGPGEVWLPGIPGNSRHRRRPRSVQQRRPLRARASPDRSPTHGRRLEDNGIGFDPDALHGHGVTDSILDLDAEPEGTRASARPSGRDFDRAVLALVIVDADGIRSLFQPIELNLKVDTDWR